MKKAVRRTIIVLIAIMAMAIATVSVNANSSNVSSVNIKQDSVQLKAGQTAGLGVVYSLTSSTNNVDAKTDLHWKSNNTSVATVNGGTVKAVKAGTATITVEINGKVDTCKITVTASPAKWIDASGAYTQLNNYRKADKSLVKAAKATYNKEVKKAKKIKNKAKRNKAIAAAKTKYNNTITLRRDANLEKIAKIRAEEMAKSGKFSHTRPNGKSGLTLIPGNVAKGENIAMGQKTCAQVSKDWYNSKGHRANMLRSNFTRVGIACYEYNGVTYWAQVFAG